jgi:hypothetical protein
MKKLAIVFALIACTNPALSRTTPVGPSIVIPGAQLDDVRDAVVSQLTSKGYSVLVAEKYRVAAELPMRSDWSGNFYTHREYRLGEHRDGITITAGGGLVDKSPPQTRNYLARDAAQMRVENDLSADLAAIKGLFLEKK